MHRSFLTSFFYITLTLTGSGSVLSYVKCYRSVTNAGVHTRPITSVDSQNPQAVMDPWSINVRSLDVATVAWLQWKQIFFGTEWKNGKCSHSSSQSIGNRFSDEWNYDLNATLKTREEKTLTVVLPGFTHRYITYVYVYGFTSLVCRPSNELWS